MKALLLCIVVSISAASAQARPRVCEHVFAARPLIEDVAKLKAISKLPAAERKQALFAYAKPVKKTWRSKAFVVADWAMATLIAGQIAMGLHHDPSAILPTLAVIPPTLFAADLIGQIFHKYLDSYANESHVVLGSDAREFRKHHEVPANLNQEDYLSHVSSFGVAFAPVFAAATAAHMSPEAATSSVILLLALMNATEVHKQAHLTNPGRFFSALQSLKLTISMRDHAKHHRPPFEDDYVVLNGWSAPLTRKLWHRLDLIYWKAFQRMPNNWVQDPRSIPPRVLVDLQRDLSQVPDELWAYAELYPKRLPNELLQKAEQ